MWSSMYLINIDDKVDSFIISLVIFIISLFHYLNIHYYHLICIVSRRRFPTHFCSSEAFGTGRAIMFYTFGFETLQR